MDNGRSKVKMYFSYIGPGNEQWYKYTQEIVQLYRTGRCTVVKVHSRNISVMLGRKMDNGKIILITISDISGRYIIRLVICRLTDKFEINVMNNKKNQETRNFIR